MAVLKINEEWIRDCAAVWDCWCGFTLAQSRFFDRITIVIILFG
jgi:hypothetical protein